MEVCASHKIFGRRDTQPSCKTQMKDKRQPRTFGEHPENIRRGKEGNASALGHNSSTRVHGASPIPKGDGGSGRSHRSISLVLRKENRHFCCRYRRHYRRRAKWRGHRRRFAERRVRQQGEPTEATAERSARSALRRGVVFGTTTPAETVV
ncbi:unnamed protein product [Pylaiella littoralis]